MGARINGVINLIRQTRLPIHLSRPNFGVPLYVETNYSIIRFALIIDVGITAQVHYRTPSCEFLLSFAVVEEEEIPAVAETAPEAERFTSEDVVLTGSTPQVSPGKSSLTRKIEEMRERERELR